MHAFQAPYRALLDQLLYDDLDESSLSRILADWLKDNSTERAWLDGLRELGRESVPELPIEDIWRLYALSRVSDDLICGVVGGALNPDCYECFMLGLGLESIPDVPFHPFYHELATVTESPGASSEIELLEYLWPGFMCGSLLVSRAGVSVSSGTKHLCKNVAESSTLYWAYTRLNRPTEDLSIGWGGNSQWRTGFRRDYVFSDRFEYNVDASPLDEETDLTEDQEYELVRNRCLVLSKSDHADLWPYYLRYTEKRAEQDDAPKP